MLKEQLSYAPLCVDYDSTRTGALPLGQDPKRIEAIS
jgi:hypothetical protein